MAKMSDSKQGQHNHDVDRFPTPAEALRRLAQDPTLYDGQVQRISITAQANGELAYKLWPPRAEEAEIGYLEPPQK